MDVSSLLAEEDPKPVEKEILRLNDEAMKSLHSGQPAAARISLDRANELLSSRSLRSNRLKRGFLLGITMNNQACYYKKYALR